MRPLRLFSCVTCAVVLLLPSVGGAQALPGCYERVYAAYARAQRAYQDTLQAMLLGEAPHLEGLIRLTHDQQVTLISSYERAVAHALRHEPSAVRVDGPLNQWLILDGDDMARLQARDSTYARLRRRGDELTGQSNGHKDWPALRVVFRERVLPRPDHKAMFQRVVHLMRTTGAECRPAGGGQR